MRLFAKLFCAKCNLAMKTTIRGVKADVEHLGMADPAANVYYHRGDEQ
jgi:hypothetical protein